MQQHSLNITLANCGTTQLRALSYDYTTRFLFPNNLNFVKNKDFKNQIKKNKT